MKKKIFISVAVWGSDYTATFVALSLATQLSKNNIPRVSLDCEIIYHIITTHEDKRWLEKQPQMIQLQNYCQLEWDFIGNENEPGVIPKGIHSDKYFFLSVLQNIAMNRAIHSDLIIFNYADFIWADGSIYHLIQPFDNGIDAVVSFCLPVDQHAGSTAIKAFAHPTSPQEGDAITLPPRTAVDIALNCLHREAERRFWDDKEFTVTPTYILWRVENEGIIITAYHQTILALRVNTQSPFYHNGIITSSLDGFYSAVLAANGQLFHATNSDDIFVFSLYDTVLDSAIAGQFSREDSVRACLGGSVTEKQRDLALHPIEVRKSYLNESLWNQAKIDATQILKKLHADTRFDPELYNAIYFDRSISTPDTTVAGTGLTMTSQVKALFHFFKQLFRLGIHRTQAILIDALIPNNVALNGNFDRWNQQQLKYKEGAWIALPAPHWVGHFDFFAEGTFEKSALVPNEHSVYSLVVTGTEGGKTAYVGQQIPAAAVLRIRKTGSLFCCGYIRSEGGAGRTILLTLLLPEKKDDFTRYKDKPLATIKIEHSNTWQYFEVACHNITAESQLCNGALLFFMLSRLESPDHKIYLSQLQFNAENPAPFKPRSLKEERRIIRRTAWMNTLLKQKKRFRIGVEKLDFLSLTSEQQGESSLNSQRIIKVLNQNKMEELIHVILNHVHPIVIGDRQLLDHTMAAYFWIGLLPERFINEVSDLTSLMRLLTDAETALQKLISLAPLYAEGYRALARNLWMQGRHDEALFQFQQAEKQRHQFAESVDLDPNAVVLLPVNCAHVIGLMGHLDAFIKRKILLGDKRPYHLMVQDNEIVNPVFFEYWKPYVQLGLPPIKTETTAITLAYTMDWNWAIPQSKDEVAHVHTAIARIQRQWAQENRKPLLVLSDEHQQVLQQFKIMMGMQKEDWFVCLHVRSRGFYGDKKNTAQDFRNTPIEDYHLAIKAVIDAGGWVIRMGDATSPPLVMDTDNFDKLKVIDYAHLPERSAELDVVLSASCRLFISSPSGLHTVAHAFGRPVCYVNYPIYAGFPWHPHEIFIPMLYYSLAEHQIIPMDKILSSNLVYADHQHLISKERIILLRNTPDEIAETVMEALRGSAYTLPNMIQAKKARQMFFELNETYARNISGKIGLYFAEKHRNALFPTTRHALKKRTRYDHTENA